MVKILNNLPSEYDVILDGLENSLTLTGSDALTVECIRDKLNNWYEQIKQTDDTNDEDDKMEKDVAMYAKSYKGRCTHCREIGHEGPSSPKRQNNNGNGHQNKGICFYCGGMIHYRNECKL